MTGRVAARFVFPFLVRAVCIVTITKSLFSTCFKGQRNYQQTVALCGLAIPSIKSTILVHEANVFFFFQFVLLAKPCLYTCPEWCYDPCLEQAEVFVGNAYGTSFWASPVTELHSLPEHGARLSYWLDCGILTARLCAWIASFRARNVDNAEP